MISTAVEWDLQARERLGSVSFSSRSGLNGLSNAEIAEREGIPLATVGIWLRRSRQELRERLRPLLRKMGGS